MRHGKKFNHLSRKVGHRRAMLSNMASSLIRYKRINTTVAKAKALKKYVEPLITKAKNDTTHSRRTVFSYLQDKESIAELFGEVAVKVGDRPGGYTRILRTGNRLGDNADMCMIELVDFNEAMLEQSKTKTKSTRRGRRKKSSSNKEETTNKATESASAKKEEKPAAKKEDSKEKEAKAKTEDSKKAEKKPEAKAEKPAADKKEAKPKAESNKTEKKEGGKDDKKKDDGKSDSGTKE